jgi:hypothetical protein
MVRELSDSLDARHGPAAWQCVKANIDLGLGRTREGEAYDCRARWSRGLQ